MSSSAYGVFEQAAAGDSEQKRQQRIAADKMAAAIYDVKDQFGSFLSGAEDVQDFRHRVALVRDDMIKTVEPHLFPRTGIMRRICKQLEREFTAADKGDALIPEGDFHAYKDKVDDNAESKMDKIWVETENTEHHTGDPAKTLFAKTKKAAEGEVDAGASASGSIDVAPDVYVPGEALQSTVDHFAAWCRTAKVTPSLDTLDRYAATYQAPDEVYIALVSALQHTASRIEASRRTAAPDYLTKADEALTNLLNQRAEEFQQTIEPLQQALMVVQQAEAEQQAANPMNVMPGGQINVMPPGTGAPAGGGDPMGGGMPPGGGGDPMADPAMAAMMGGGDPAMGGGAPPMDPGMGGDPMAGGGGDIPPEIAQMMMQGSRRQAYDPDRSWGGDPDYQKIDTNAPPPALDAVRAQGWSPEDQAVVEKLMAEYGLDPVDAIQEFHALKQGKKASPKKGEARKGRTPQRQVKVGSGELHPVWADQGYTTEMLDSWRKDNPHMQDASYNDMAEFNQSIMLGLGGEDFRSPHDWQAFKKSQPQAWVGGRSYYESPNVQKKYPGYDTRGNKLGRSSSAITAADVVQKFEDWAQKRPGLPTGSEVDIEQFATENQVGPRAKNKLKQHLVSAGIEDGTSDDFYAPAAGYEYEDPYQQNGWKMTRATEDGSAEWVHPSGFSVSGHDGPDGGSWQLFDSKGAFGKPFTDPGEAQDAILKQLKSGSRKQAWMGFGSEQPGAHKVAGWEWDSYLNAHVASKPREFTCSCGKPFAAPSGFQRCACGKQWNSYVIGTGGDRHEASAEKYLVREIPTRDGVIVAAKTADCEDDKDKGDDDCDADKDEDCPPWEKDASRDFARFVAEAFTARESALTKLTDPGEITDTEDSGTPEMKQPPEDWARRNPDGKWNKGPRRSI